MVLFFFTKKKKKKKKLGQGRGYKNNAGKEKAIYA